ncbi:MAG: FAD-binding oxidoreductase, partial [Gemmataceae bacterium]|nr:FAD-binding oxidoreductase [Gemmataceae bacterium]
RDMTITARAGTTVAHLQAELAKEGQWLPVDVPSPERATLGGILAVNASGPRRLACGTLRDYVIGISFVTDDGVEVKAGGRVVKNVAGYDLMKLQIGALGTLGVVTQVTLKVRPRPEAACAVLVECSAANLTAVFDRVWVSKTRPVAVELLNAAARRAAGVGPPADPAGGADVWALLVAFEEKAAAVRWQVATLLDELKSAPVAAVRELPDTSLLDALTGLQQRPESRFIGKWAVVPSLLPAEALRLPAGAPVHAHALNGVIWAHADEPLPPGAVVYRCPPGFPKAPTGGRPGEWELMRHVKKTLDPDNVFNPGRLFGDI